MSTYFFICRVFNMSSYRIGVCLTVDRFASTDRTNEEKFKIRLDVRNFRKENLKIKFDSGYLVVIGKKHEVINRYNLGFTLMSKKFKIPEDVDRARIAAKLSPRGVLVIYAPRNVHQDTETGLDH